MSKDRKSAEVVELGAMDGGAFAEPKKNHTNNDAADMRRMGKAQQFQVCISFQAAASPCTEWETEETIS